MSETKVALGCRLFFEPQLSVTREYSCASCHRPELAFTDGRAHAVGAKGDTLERSAMTLANVAYSPAYTWASNAVTTLEAQMEQPLFNEHPIEMGLARDDAQLRERLVGDYMEAFRAAFPAEAEPITVSNAIKAIASYERTLISGRSPFDRYVYDDDRTALSASARRGMQLFFSERGRCAQCHFGVTFSGPIAHRGRPKQAALFANNGSPSLMDAGLTRVTKRRDDSGRFKVPTLRNVALTAPYMHNGAYATLEDVVEHYSAGGRNAASTGRLDERMRPLQLSAAEKKDLVEFLRSLTDEEVVRASRCAPRS